MIHFARISAALIVSLALFAQSPAFAEPLPQDAREMLDGFPGKKLSLDVVLQRAMQSSDSFRQVQAQRVGAEAAFQQSQALTDVRLQLGANRVVSKLEPTSPFGTTRSISSGFSLGASKLFSTGTTLGFELLHGYSDLNFASPTVPPTARFETRGTVSLTQNLWKDAFGAATRAASLAGELSSEAGRAGFQESAEAWALDLTQVYYSAWLSQAQLEAAEGGVKRRQRLLDMTEIKLRRGNAERPDLLQVRSAMNNSKIQQDQARQILGDVWRNLVTQLKLPTHWIQIDPKDIPLALDMPVDQAIAACGPQAGLNKPPETTASARRARLQLQAAEASLKRAESESKPDLELFVRYTNNGVIDPRLPDQESTFKEFSRLDHPEWAGGVNFILPLGFHLERSQVITAMATELQARAASGQVVEGILTQWVNLCLDLHRNVSAYELSREANTFQSQRAVLEEERFKIGRSSTLQVIQAGDDATQAELSLRGAEVNRRMAAWRVLRMTGGLQEYLKKLVPAAGGQS